MFFVSKPEFHNVNFLLSCQLSPQTLLYDLSYLSLAHGLCSLGAETSWTISWHVFPFFLGVLIFRYCQTKVGLVLGKLPSSSNLIFQPGRPEIVSYHLATQMRISFPPSKNSNSSFKFVTEYSGHKKSTHPYETAGFFKI